MAGPNQFTPRQVLDAGRRAEVDGKRNYAIQFYQHVLAHHPETSEASEADQALRRLAGEGQDPRTQSPQQPYASQMNGVQHRPTPASQPSSERVATHPRSTARQTDAVRREERTAGVGAERSKSNSQAVAAASPAVRGKVTRYRLGRFLAGFMSLVGGVTLTFAVGSLAANAFAYLVGPLPPFVSLIVVNPAFSATAAALAAILLLVAQMAKALFALAASIHQALHGSSD